MADQRHTSAMPVVESGRRALLRAAWTAPVITAVAAAPAFAAYTKTLGIGSLTAVVSDYSGHTSAGITISAQQLSLSGTGSVTSMSMSVFVPAYQDTSNNWWYPTFGSVGAGWSQVGSGVQTTTGTRGTTYSFISGSGVTAPGTYAYPLTLVVYYYNNGWGQISTTNSRVVNATLSATGATAATKSATVTAASTSSTTRSGSKAANSVSLA